MQVHLQAREATLDAAREPAYMRGRTKLRTELEGLLGALPFERFTVVSDERSAPEVATVKAIVHLGTPGEPLPAAKQAVLEAMTQPRPCTWRRLGTGDCQNVIAVIAAIAVIAVWLGAGDLPERE